MPNFIPVTADRCNAAIKPRPTTDDERSIYSILPGWLNERTWQRDHEAPANAFLDIAADSDDDIAIVEDIAVISVQGALRKRPSLMMRALRIGSTYQDIIDDLNAAVNHDRVRGVVMYIDSPGGTVAGGSDAVDAIRAARAQMPVVAYISDLGASAAYRLASQADTIVADRDAEVGSIGTYAIVEDLSKMADEMGVKVHVVKAGEFKAAGAPGTPVTDAQLAEFQRQVDELNDIFLTEVAEGRSMSIDAVRKLADGAVHIGQAAVARGLIDRVGTLEDAIAAARTARDERNRNQIRRTLIQRQLQRTGAQRR